MLKPGLQSQPRIFIVNIIRKKIKRWLKDMNLMFSWYDKYLTGLLRSLVWYCFCHSNKKFTYSRRRVIPLSFRPVEQKSPKGRSFILLSFFLWRREETERLSFCLFTRVGSERKCELKKMKIFYSLRWRLRLHLRWGRSQEQFLAFAFAFTFWSDWLAEGGVSTNPITLFGNWFYFSELAQYKYYTYFKSMCQLGT